MILIVLAVVASAVWQTSRTALLMKGVFTTVAPVLQVKDTFLTFDELFHGDALNIDLILSLVRC